MSLKNVTVQDLVSMVTRGELKLPEMQRRYVWPATRVRDLLDSLYRGYPSGTILVWQTDEDVEMVDMAVASTEAPIHEKLLLLDGQQRVTSLAAILTGQPVHIRNRKRPIHILFNLEHPEGPPIEVTEVDENDTSITNDEDEDNEDEAGIQEELKKRAFVVGTNQFKNDPLWVSASDVFVKTDRELLRPLGINSDDQRWDKYSQRLQRVRDISKYIYVMNELGKDMSYEEVTEIFVRVNSLGVKLRGSDLAMAQITSRWPGFMQRVEDFAGRFDEDADYLVKAGLPVRMLVVFATNQCKFKTAGKISLIKLQQAWDQAVDGLEFAVNFLRSNAFIESLDALSSPFLLIPIAAFWSINEGKVSPTQSKALLRWFYLAHMRGHYGMGSSETLLDADLAALRANGLEGMIQRLEMHVRKFDVDAEDLAGKSIRSPFFSMLNFVLKQNGAKDWWSNLRLSDKHRGSAHTIQYHHIFPKSLLHEAAYEKKEINEIANMAFIGGKTNRQILNHPPAQYLEHDVVPKAGEEALSLQLIPLDRSLWEMNRYRDFLQYRRQAIAEAINEFLKKLV